VKPADITIGGDAWVADSLTFVLKRFSHAVRAVPERRHPSAGDSGPAAAGTPARRRMALRISETTTIASPTQLQMSHCWTSRLVVSSSPSTVARISVSTEAIVARLNVRSENVSADVPPQDAAK
jgi:hypothetical protein